MNPYLFLWHCPFKDLYKSFKKWPLTPRSLEWLCAVSYCRELDFAQYDTAQNLTPRSMILRRVNLEKLEYLGENETKFVNISTHYSVPARQTRIMKKKNSSKILLDCPFKKDTEKSHLIPRSIILRRTWLPAVWYCAELDSAQYNTERNFGKIRISGQKRN